jgi:hypothetical protein
MGAYSARPRSLAASTSDPSPRARVDAMIHPPIEPRNRRWLLPTAVGVGAFLFGLIIGFAGGFAGGRAMPRRPRRRPRPQAPRRRPRRTQTAAAPARPVDAIATAITAATCPLTPQTQTRRGRQGRYQSRRVVTLSPRSHGVELLTVGTGQIYAGWPRSAVSACFYSAETRITF